MYVQYDIDILAMIVIVIIFINNYNDRGSKLVHHKIFSFLLIVDFFILLVDMLIFIIMGKPGEVVHFLLYILQILFFILCCIFCLGWLFFCTYRVLPLKLRKKSVIIVYLIPFLVLTSSLVMSFFKGYIFYITFDNNYLRGSYFHIISLCTYIYILIGISIILKYRKMLTRIERNIYLFVPIFSIIIGIIQLSFRIEVLLVWPSLIVPFLIVQTYIVNDKLYTDYLTGLSNRMYLDEYIDNIIKKNYKSGEEILAAIMLDLDNFKYINDKFGHIEGDKVLKETANILKNSTKTDGSVSRYGGDEFFIILDKNKVELLETILNKIHILTDKFNNESLLPYNLSFSLGFKVFIKEKDLTKEEIITTIDKLMYKHKCLKKQGKKPCF